MRTKVQQFESMGLLNFEGDVLTAHRIPGILEDPLFLITDQWKNPIKLLTKEQFFNFLLGDFSITDTYGRAWNWPIESEDARPSANRLKIFMEAR